ncbi:MAG: Rieske 2Fe-2S domain-containing protein [Verrucomicrobia bacterium]|nr:Rieske 2Fe-2S domain-containing protein [Verrucomicrobiota bacterium]
MTELARVDEIPEDRGYRVQVDGKHIALFKVDDEVFAINAVCPHAGAFLDMGFLEDYTIICPLHGWDFDIRSGVSPSYGVKTPCYPIEVKDGIVYLKDSD